MHFLKQHRIYDNTEDIQYVRAIHSLDGGLDHGCVQSWCIPGWFGLDGLFA